MAFDASKYVLYLENWQVLICLHENCRYCLIPNGTKRHFQRRHSTIYELSLRKQIEGYAETLTLCQPSDIVVPMNTPPPIPGLKIWNGWQCTVCFKVGPAMDGGNQHCTDKHGWKTGRGERNHHERANYCQRKYGNLNLCRLFSQKQREPSSQFNPSHISCPNRQYQHL